MNRRATASRSDLSLPDHSAFYDSPAFQPGRRRGNHRPSVLPITMLVLCAAVAGALLVPRPAEPGATGGEPEAAAGLLAPPEMLAPLSAASHSPLPQNCSGGCTEELTAPSGWKFQVFRNFPMSGTAAVTRAVLVVHGTGRNAQGYFSSMMAAASQSGVASSTMVIAPWFKTSQDKPQSGEATWTSGAWKIGGGAESPSGLSSFQVMDQLLATLASKQRFPHLREIVVSGHSAGGQFTQRYAAFGLAPNALTGVHITYAPADPSSFVYFTSARPSGSGFSTPSSSSCSAYDTYKYGLKGRSGYAGELNAQQAALNYTLRTVTIINGGSDTFNNGDMDTDCGAMLEGPNRATRGAKYVDYIHTIAPATSARQTRIVVPGVDHDGDKIFTSPLVRNVLFPPLNGGRQASLSTSPPSNSATPDATNATETSSSSSSGETSTSAAGADDDEDK